MTYSSEKETLSKKGPQRFSQSFFFACISSFDVRLVRQTSMREKKFVIKWRSDNHVNQLKLIKKLGIFSVVRVCYTLNKKVFSISCLQPSLIPFWGKVFVCLSAEVTLSKFARTTKVPFEVKDLPFHFLNLFILFKFMGILFYLCKKAAKVFSLFSSFTKKILYFPQLVPFIFDLHYYNLKHV